MGRRCAVERGGAASTSSSKHTLLRWRLEGSLALGVGRINLAP